MKIDLITVETKIHVHFNNDYAERNFSIDISGSKHEFTKANWLEDESIPWEKLHSEDKARLFYILDGIGN